MNSRNWPRSQCVASQLSWSSMTHRYRGGHRFKSRWSPDIFQASFFQLLKLENLLRWSLFTFFFVSFVLHHLWVWQIFTLRMSHRVCMEKKCYKTQSCRSIKSYYKFGMQTSNSVNIILLITEKSAVSCSFIPQQSLILEALNNSFSWLLYQLFRWSATPLYCFKCTSKRAGWTVNFWEFCGHFRNTPSTMVRHRPQTVWLGAGQKSTALWAQP